jgi:signal transduction histidine kinase
MDLVGWLENNNAALIDVAVNRLAQSESLRQTVVESTEAFFDGLRRTLRTNNPLPLNLILLDWIEARSAPTDEDLAGLLPVLIALKNVAWEVLCERAPQDVLIDWLTELDNAFSRATDFLFTLEAEALLKDTTNELNRALLDVERLNKSKSDFIAVAAHELKTPLTLIEGYTNMLKAEFPESERPQVDLMLTGISGGTKRLREIIQDMIDVSLIEMDLLKLHYQPVWLHRLVDILQFDFGEKLRQRQLALEIDRDSITTRPTYGDPERLYQVLQKVVSNAVKFTPDGGRIQLRGRDLPGFTELVVEDTGIGIAPEDLQRIFEKFSSLGDIALHSSGKTKFKGGGPGLGLAIAKGIIEAHGGTIWAESPGYDEHALPGSIFHVMVPMRSAPPEDRMAELFTSDTVSSLSTD